MIKEIGNIPLPSKQLPFGEIEVMRVLSNDKRARLEMQNISRFRALATQILDRLSTNTNEDSTKGAVVNEFVV